MAQEIERKFLLASEDWRAAVTHSQRMAQGYLTRLDGDLRASVRVRIAADQAWLNFKSLTLGIARLEYEYPIPLRDAEEMLQQLCVDGRIEKTRHYIPQGALTWEIDEFWGENAGLIVAEIELPSVDTAVELPAWIATEVTDDPRYYNVALAIRPYQRWGDAPAFGFEVSAQ
ncbi:CYTH domain-containing protein [Halothiobacillus sp. DCM-1]|uniref:CYTH domain-containing protein n=1 Tax=Halothiobacillus sp. DCM-1 TaxID=3112558 RepID=UPI00324DBEA8